MSLFSVYSLGTFYAAHWPFIMPPILYSLQKAHMHNLPAALTH